MATEYHDVTTEELTALNAAVDASGLSRAELARRLNVHRSTIGRILDGAQSRVNEPLFRQLLRALSPEALQRHERATQLELALDEVFRAARAQLALELERLRLTLGSGVNEPIKATFGVDLPIEEGASQLYQRSWLISA